MSNVELPAIFYTPNIIAGNLVQDLNNDQSNQAAVEQQLSSGLMINSPSDNPSGASSVMYLKAGLGRAQQYVSNANDGLGWLSLGNSTMNSMLSTLQQARQAVVSLSGNALAGNQSAIAGTAAQLQSTKQEVISLANTTYGNQAIFSGTGNVSQAYDSNGNYVGAGGSPTRTVAPGVTVPVSATGPQVFGSGATGLLNPGGVLDTLIQDVQTGTPASLQQATTTDLQALDSAISTVENQAAQLGASYQRMQAFSEQATSAQAALQTQVSSIDSVNVAQATTQLTQDQQTYQTGLWATAQIEEHSLVSYL